MTIDRDQQVRALYQAALQQAGSARAAFIAAQAAGDTALEQSVLALLRQDTTAIRPAAGRAAIAPGAQIGGYRLEAALGAGGMGVVYQATDTRLHRPIAVKFLSEDLLDADARRRFQREAQMASALNHPHILTIYDVGEHDGRQYLVTECIEGGTLSDWLHGPEPHSWRQGVELLTGVADGLAAAHAANILHRDVKPANILISKDGCAKLADFGLAKLAEGVAPARAADERFTVAGTVIGTIAYMSPEQAAGRALDARSDIFSFGVVLYEVLCGRLPFTGDTDLEVLQMVIHGAPLPLLAELPEALRTIVEKAIEKDPAERYQTMRDVVVDLRRVARRQSGVQAEALPLPARRPARPGWIAAVIAIAVAVAGVGTWFVLHPSAPVANPLAGARFTRLTDFPGDEFYAAISPDGRFVTFVSHRDGPSDLWIMQIGTGRYVNLTNGDFQSAPWVRDGGFTGDGSEVWLRGPPPSTQRLRLLPLMGGTPRPFLDDLAVNVDWSPDGARIVYQSVATGDPLYIAARDGTNARQIYVDLPGSHNHFPTWSTDGEWIYFVKVTMATVEGDLWRIAAAGGEPQRLTHNNKYLGFPTPLDARTVLYVANDTDGSGPWLWSLDIESGIAQRLISGIEQYTSIAASADRRRLVAAVANPAANLWSIPILDDRLADENDVEAYAVPSIRARAPRFAGAALYYLSSRGGGDGLWRVEGGQAMEIWRGAEGALEEPAAISADGLQVAVVIRRSGRERLWLLRADGAEPRGLTDTLDVRGAPAWSPDGQWLAIGGNDAEGPGLFKIPAAGGAPVRLAATGFNPVWSPGGDLIAYTGANIAGRAPLLAVTPEGDPVALPAIEFSGNGERVRFLPGGQALIYMQDFDRQGFWLLDLETMQTRQLTRLSSTDTMRTFDIMPDGRRIVFDRLRQNSDIVLIERRPDP